MHHSTLLNTLKASLTKRCIRLTNLQATRTQMKPSISHPSRMGRVTTMVELSSSNLKSNVHSPGSIRPSERALAKMKLEIPPLLQYSDVKSRPLTSAWSCFVVLLQAFLLLNMRSLASKELIHFLNQLFVLEFILFCLLVEAILHVSLHGHALL